MSQKPREFLFHSDLATNQTGYPSKLEEAYAKLQKELEESKELLREVDDVLVSMHIDDFNWNLDELEVEIARGWHKSNNQKIENLIAKIRGRK
jgi:hypothetical protein